MKNKIFYLLLLYFFSCAESEKNSGLPDWFLNPPNEPGIFYGIGNGLGDERLAIVAAISEIVSQIGTKVESSFFSDSTDGYSEDNFSSFVNMNIGNISIESIIEDTVKIDLETKSETENFRWNFNIKFEDFSLIADQWSKGIGMDGNYGTSFHYEHVGNYYPSLERIYKELDENGVRLVKRKEYDKKESGVWETRYFVLLSYDDQVEKEANLEELKAEKESYKD